jgi:hypothetical protein
MDIDVENALQIDTYIKEHPQCATGRSEPVELEGEVTEQFVYRLPIEFLRYNIRNGRFAAEYNELKQEHKRNLDSSKKGDAATIKELLLNLDAKAAHILQEDLKRVGQKYPGIITFDGYVINGNRRMAVLQSLYEQTHSEEFGYLKVARLPKTVKPKDIWRIEAGIQLSRQEKLDYGPVNTLLKFKEGVDAHLTPKQIAASLYGGFTEKEIKESLERLKLIESYLKFIKQPSHYKIVEKQEIHEHFSDLQRTINKERNKGTSADEILKITKAGFALIGDGLAHREIRELSSMMDNSAARAKIMKAAQTIPKTYVPASTNGPKSSKSSNADDSPTRGSSTMVEAFYEGKDIKEAADQKGKPIKLLTRALTNLENIDAGNPALKTGNARKLINEILDIANKLKRSSK